MDINRLNRDVSLMIKDSSFVIRVDGEDVSVNFKKYTSCDAGHAEMVCSPQNKTTEYILRYDYNLGILTDVKSGKEVVVDDTYSSRKICTILFAAKEALLRQNEIYEESFTKKYHDYERQESRCEIPVIGREDADIYRKKYFHMGEILDINSRKAIISGELSIMTNDMLRHLPVNATLEIEFQPDNYTWEYLYNGKVVKESVYEHSAYGSADALGDDSRLIYAYALHLRNVEHAFSSPYPELNDKAIEIAGDERIYFVSSNPDDLGLFLAPYVIILSILLITPDKVVFQICDGKRLADELIVDRVKNKVFAYDRTSASRRKKHALDMPHNDGGRFKKILNLIDEYSEPHKKL